MKKIDRYIIIIIAYLKTRINKIKRHRKLSATKALEFSTLIKAGR